MTTTTVTLKQPCMLYQAKFTHTVMDKVKITQHYDDNSTKMKKCPIFTGVEGIEGLLYVEEWHRSLACQLQFTIGTE
eukprot:11279358-Ditylum_brightwellii.AAC.1